MKHIVKFFPEIIVKSRSVRKEMSRVLQSNIRNVLGRSGVKVRIQDCWDKLVIRPDERYPCPRTAAEIGELLGRIPGIHAVLEAEEYGYSSLRDVYEKTAAVYGEKLAGKTFCVRVKRKGNQDFSSVDVERYVGGELHDNFPSAGVRLEDPDLTVSIEIDGDRMFLVTAVRPGMGGYPLSTQDDVLSLISGGFDSGVSTYMLIRRGCRVHYLFFNLGGTEHETGVMRECYYLWDKYASSHRVRFISVPFEKMVGEILTKTHHSVRGVILKRMMLRAAAAVAARAGAGALATGESLGQVSSQTLANLAVIDAAAGVLVLRPLIAADKQDIIDRAREIGTIRFAETMPEYCGIISDRPTVRADPAFVASEEAKIDPALAGELAAAARWTDIRDVPGITAEMIERDVEVTEFAASNEVVVDIRTREEIEARPLVTEKEHLEIPFFKISSVFGGLDRTRTYLLYCGKGVMSRMQARHLMDLGYRNVKVYREPEKRAGSCAAPPRERPAGGGE